MTTAPPCRAPAGPSGSTPTTCWTTSRSSVAHGSVCSLVAVVDVPDVERRCPEGLAGPSAGVEELFGQDPVVAFDLAVVPGRVGPDPLVAGHGGHGPVERRRGVVGPVVGDHPGQAIYAVGGEERPGPMEEGGGRGRLLVAQVLGVVVAVVAVDGGVQVD